MSATQFEIAKQSWQAEIGRTRGKLLRAQARIEAQRQARKKLEWELAKLREQLAKERAKSAGG